MVTFKGRASRDGFVIIIERRRPNKSKETRDTIRDRPRQRRKTEHRIGKEKEKETEKVQQHDDTQLGQSGKILNEKLEGTPNPERP